MTKLVMEKIIKCSKYRHFGEIISLIINIYNKTVGNKHKRNMDILPLELCKRIGSDYVKKTDYKSEVVVRVICLF